MNWRSTQCPKIKHEVRSSKIKLYNMIALLAICLSLALAAFSQAPRPTTLSGNDAGAQETVVRPGASQSVGAPGLAKTQVAQSKPAKSEAFPLMIYLLDRYAQGVSDKTNFDRAVERALAGKSNGRELARRLVAAFRNIPLEERKAKYGAMADFSARQSITEAQISNAFKALPNPLIKLQRLPEKIEPPLPPSKIQSPMLRQSNRGTGIGHPDARGIINIDQSILRDASFYSMEHALRLTPASFAPSATQPTVQLYYQGLYCRDTTRLLDHRRNSDEIYIITVVLEEGTQQVRVTRHPSESRRNYYGGVDSGEVRNEPAVPIWSGAPQDLTLVSLVVEKDKGNPERFDDLIEAGGRVGEELVRAANNGNVWAAIVDLAVEIITLGVKAILKDDVIAETYTGISASDLLRFSRTPMIEWRPSERQPYLNYHFHVRHKGERGDYYVMFGVPSTVPLPPPVPVTVRIHKVKRIGDLESRRRGQADFRGRITIAGEERRFSWESADEFYPTYQWFFTKNVQGDNVTITLKLYEEDPRRNDHCDINPGSGAKDLTFTYNRATGRISGDVSGMRGQVIPARGAGDNNRAEIHFSVDWVDRLP